MGAAADMPNSTKKTASALLAGASLLALAACAGGGGSGTATNVPVPTALGTTPQTLDPNSFRTSDYLQIGVLDAVHAADAYALGYTGKGVTIGIVDYNFVFSSKMVNFSPDSLGPNPQMQAIANAQFGSGAATTDQHGQAVAVTAAGVGNGTGFQGLAFNSQVLGVDYYSDVNETQILQNGTVFHVSDPYTYITSRGIRIINTSFGYEAGGIKTLAVSQASQAPAASEGYGLVSGATAVKNGALLVSSAGNAGGAIPQQSDLDILGDLQASGILNTGTGAFIIAGAVDQNNQIASFSDRAGPYAAFYMVAPGVDLLLPWNGNVEFKSGTSFSAPLISAAAAIVMERWPNLTARQVAQILEESATPLGDRSIYGYGMLNVYAALQPLGTTTVPVASGSLPGGFGSSGSGIGSAGVVIATPDAPTVASTGMVLGSAFGDAPSLHQALSQIMILDSFGRDFEINLSKALVALPTLPDLFGVMEQRFAWHNAGLNLGPNMAASLDFRSNPEDGIVSFGATGGLSGQLRHQSTFRVAGADGEFFWSAGTGMSLRQGMMSDGNDPFLTSSITNGFLPGVGSPSGSFVSAGVPLDESTGLSFGIGEAHNQGLMDVNLPYSNDSKTVALRLDYEKPGWHFSFDVGSSLDSGGIFGSLSSGGLKIDQGTTSWATATAQWKLDARWMMRGSVTLAVAGATHPQASLITSIGPVTASSFAFGLAGNSIFRDSDQVLFTVSQPMRAELGVATLSTGIGRDWSTGGVIMGLAQAPLAPSGREVDLETGYGFGLGSWRMQANAGFALDAGHMRGNNSILSLVTLSRAF
jgi:hypothetical protein